MMNHDVEASSETDNEIDKDVTQNHTLFLKQADCTAIGQSIELILDVPRIVTSLTSMGLASCAYQTPLCNGGSDSISRPSSEMEMLRD